MNNMYCKSGYLRVEKIYTSYGVSLKPCKKKKNCAYGKKLTSINNPFYSIINGKENITD